MPVNPLKTMIEKNRNGQKIGLYSVCSANDLVLRSAIRHAVTHKYPLIIESTSNQVNQEGGYTGMRPHEFMANVQKIAQEEGMPEENLILGGDHLGPQPWQKEPCGSAMGKAVEMVRAYTLAGFTKIHLDTSMKLADDPPGPLDLNVCARRGAALAKVVYESFAGTKCQDAQYQEAPNQARRPALVIGSEVPIPGGQKNEGQEHEETVTPTGADDFLRQVSVFREEFEKAGLDFGDVIAFVVQPGVEFGDDIVHFYDSEKAKPLTTALKMAPGLVFEGHSTDYQPPQRLAELVRDGVAILKVGPALSFALREGLFLLEAVEEAIIPAAFRSNLKKTLLQEMDKNKLYWEKYYSGSPEEVEYKKLYSYSDRCRYYLPVKEVQKSIETLFANIPQIPSALLSQFFPAQYRRYMAGKPLNEIFRNEIFRNENFRNDPVSILCDHIGNVCADYASACGYVTRDFNLPP